MIEFTISFVAFVFLFLLDWWLFHIAVNAFRANGGDMKRWRALGDKRFWPCSGFVLYFYWQYLL